MSNRIDSEAVTRARAVPIAHEIARRGIRLRRAGQELVGPCPVCGDGGKGRHSDRFAVHLRKNVWQCRRCATGGDVVGLVRHLDGVGFREAIEILTGDRPAPAPRHPAPPVQPAPTPDDDGHHRAMRRWEEAGPIAGTIAERYLIETRRLVLPADISPRVLRFHPACPFGEDTRLPCLIALYRDIVSDAPRAIMRTALTPDARKIDRKALGLTGGCAIKISDDADVTIALTVGEGLESTLAGLLKGFMPAWALGSAKAIAKLPVLAGIESLTVLGETDDDGANERAVRECFARWHAAGREVYRATSLIGGDLNDGLMVA